MGVKGMAGPNKIKVKEEGGSLVGGGRGGRVELKRSPSEEGRNGGTPPMSSFLWLRESTVDTPRKEIKSNNTSYHIGVRREGGVPAGRLERTLRGKPGTCER